jgi:hypothetical protein
LLVFPAMDSWAVAIVGTTEHHNMRERSDESARHGKMPVARSKKKGPQAALFKVDSG